MSWLGDIGDFLESVGSGVSDAFSSVGHWLGSEDIPSSSSSTLPTPEVVGTNWTTSPSSSSFWSSSLGKYISSPSGIGDIIKGGVGIYGMWDAKSRQDKADSLAREKLENDTKLQQLKMLYDLEKEKLALKYRGSEGGGGTFSKQMQMISALNSSANTQIYALNNLSSGYSNAIRR